MQGGDIIALERPGGASTTYVRLIGGEVRGYSWVIIGWWATHSLLCHIS